MGSDRIETKLNPRAWAFGTNFMFQFVPVVRSPDDKELKYFQFFSGPLLWIIQDGKSPVRYDAYFPEWKQTFSDSNAIIGFPLLCTSV